MPRISASSIDEHRQATRRALFEAAHDLFGRFGYVDTSLGDLADHAGIGRTTFYEYFTDKDDLVASLVEDALPQAFADMIERARSRPATERLADLAVSMIEFVATDPVFGLILHREVPRLGQDAQHRIAAVHRSIITEFEGLYRSGVGDGVYREMESELASRFILDVVMSGARTLIQSDDPKQRLHEVADETVRFLVGGLTVGEPL